MWHRSVPSLLACVWVFTYIYMFTRETNGIFFPFLALALKLALQ